MKEETKKSDETSYTTLDHEHINDERDFFLVQFAHRHLDFKLAELQSILDMFQLIHLCQVHPLPNDELFDISTKNIKDKNNIKNNESDFPYTKGISLISYSEKLEDQKNQTNNANPILSDISQDDKKEQMKDYDTSNDSINRRHSELNFRPFLILSFPHEFPSTSQPNDIILKALSRCVLIKSVIELWGCGNNIKSCAQNVKNMCINKKTKRYELIQRHCIEGNKTWKHTIYTFGSKYTREEQNMMRSHFSFLPFTGDVKMDDPDDEYIMIREIEVDFLGSPLYPRHSHKKVVIPENDARPPLAVYFGRVLLSGIREGKVEKYSLKKRKYLGPTSMDTELSMIMTNLGQVQRGSFCFDPFVGTGSILLTCALHGAYCYGTDIDIRVLKGKGSDENIYVNFKQFNLPRPEIVRSDNSIYHRHFIHQTPLFDSIVCDPPYGIRAGARKTGSKLSQPRPILEEHRHDHIAQTKPYAVSDVMADLLDVSARTLVLGGRLVYIIPSMTDFDPKVDLPRHDCLECIHICYQPLQTHLGRRMVTMKKCCEYDENQREKYLANTWVNGPESADKCANIREKLIELAKLKPGYEEKSEFRKKKRKARKEELKKMKKLSISSHS